MRFSTPYSPVAALLLSCALAACGDGHHIEGLDDPGPSEDAQGDLGGDLSGDALGGEQQAGDGQGGDRGEAPDPDPPPQAEKALGLDRIWPDGLPLMVDELAWSGEGEFSFLLSLSEPVEGVRLSTLGRGAFEFFEDGVPMGREVWFDLDHQADLRVALVLDLSRSMLEDDAVVELQAAVRQLLQTLPWGAEVAVIQFASDYTLVQDFTTDAGALAQAVDNLKVPEGRAGQFTNLWGAVELAAEILEGGDEDQGRAMVIFSDGLDNVAESDEGAARAALSRARAVTYAVGLGDELSPEQLVALSGDARFAAAEAPSDLRALFTDIATRLGEIVKINYVTPKTTGTHTLSVKINTGAEIGGVDIIFER